MISLGVWKHVSNYDPQLGLSIHLFSLLTFQTLLPTFRTPGPPFDLPRKKRSRLRRNESPSRWGCPAQPIGMYGSYRDVRRLHLEMLHLASPRLNRWSNRCTSSCKDRSTAPKFGVRNQVNIDLGVPIDCSVSPLHVLDARL